MSHDSRTEVLIPRPVRALGSLLLRGDANVRRGGGRLGGGGGLWALHRRIIMYSILSKVQNLDDA